MLSSIVKRSIFLPLRAFYSASVEKDLDSKKLTITKTTSPRPRPKNEDLVFGRTMSDHMLEIDWVKGEGWGAPAIKPYGPFSIEPSALVFHYAIECFEGMKAYKDSNDNIRLFRPRDNLQRLNSSAKRISLPTFSEDELYVLLKEYVKVEKDWIPKEQGYSLYLRPTMIATQAALGVQASNQAKLFIISCPVGPYYKTGFKPVKLLADDKNVRAWPGGVGSYKVGSNYAPGIVVQQAAAEKGCAQVLWLTNDNLTEAGTMNLFVYFVNEQGEKELVTPPLDGIILPGVTRSTIIEIAREHGTKVTERQISIQEFLALHNEKRLLEAFGAGTAAVVSPINGIHYKGVDYTVPLDPTNPNAGAGPLASSLHKQILDIQYGKIPSPFSEVVY